MDPIRLDLTIAPSNLCLVPRRPECIRKFGALYNALVSLPLPLPWLNW